jgi:regulator of sirC expression with transglutaminase-like and TPR domain
VTPFEALMAQPDPRLDEAMLAMALEEYPELDPAAYLARLDEWAAAVQRVGPPVRLALREVVFHQAGFRGDTGDYHSPDNSLLHRVIDRRLGIPITLAVVYLEIARRLGEPAVGLQFPGHFLIRHGGVMLDPFDDGRAVSERDCEAMLQRVAGQPVALEKWMFAESSTRATLARVLVNLKSAYLMRRDLIMAARTIDRLLVVDPDRLTDLRDRGLIYAELELVPSAVRDLEAYVARSSAKDTGVIEEVLEELRARPLRMN